MSHSVRIDDANGNEITVGARVHYWDEQPTTDENGSNIGEVVEITDFEGDVDDDTGRSIVNAPTVKVKFWRYNRFLTSESEASDKHREYFTEEFRTSDWEHDEYDYDSEGFPRKIASVGACEEMIVITDENETQNG